MAKAKVEWTFGETPATADKLNQTTLDYIRRGQLILSSTGLTLHTTTTFGPESVAVNSLPNLGWFPYNPQKQVFDRMDILFNHETIASGGGDLTTSTHLQYSLDSDASWTSANPGQSAAPVPLHPPAGLAGTTDLGASMRTVNISGITSFQWIGFRYLFDLSPEAHTWIAMAYLYLSTDTPF